jgi:hypothetical protein
LLLPVVMLNNSVYRLTVYIDNKNITNRQSIRSKFGFYVACFPLSALLSVLYNSWVPIIVTLYFLFVWLAYWLFSKTSGRDIRG